MESGSGESMRADAEKLADIFIVLQRKFLVNLSKELARGNVSFPQFFLLGYLGQHPNLSMSEIAQKMEHTMAAATGLVDRLEKFGLAHRSPSSDDGRKILVQITDDGMALVSRVREDMIASLLKMMTLLTPEEQGAWLHIYEKIFSFCHKQCPE